MSYNPCGIRSIYNRVMKRSLLMLALWLFCIPLGHSQKELSRTYSAETITQLSINANGVHELKITAGNYDEIEVRVQLEGETSEEIVIHEKVTNTSLSLGFGAWPLATIYNDKLSAHKLLSVEVSVQIPENLFVSVTSNSASVHAIGFFETLYVAIEDRRCVLEDFSGNANIETNRGKITVFTAVNDVYADATSIFGTVQNKLGTTGKFLITAQSTHGDIILKETQ